MRVVLIALVGVALAACSPPQAAKQAAPAQGPEAVVRAAFNTAAQHSAHDQPAAADDLPLSDSLKALLNQGAAAAQANDEPFIDGDIVLDCQDCSPLSAITITTIAPPANGHATVQARFTVAGDARIETWSMVETPQGWRVDNIVGDDGYDLRKSATDEIAEVARSCADRRGAQAAAQLVAQCAQVSPATHPPCNAANSCAVIEAEIRRSCGLLDAAHRPGFCNDQATDEAP